MRKRVHDLTEAATKTVDKDLAKNIVLKYLALPGKQAVNNYLLTNKYQGRANNRAFKSCRPFSALPSMKRPMPVNLR